MPYIPFTDEEKQLANSVDLAMFLQSRGEKLERIGREYKLIYYDSSGKHDSITIRGSTWFDHKNQTGGGAIKFVRHFYNMDFPEAVQELLGISRSGAVCTLGDKPEILRHRAEEKKEFKLPEANSNMHRVYAYLIKQRFIAPEIITHFAKEKLLYEDREHHNAVFVGTDENGVPKQAHLRSTNSYGNTFRITCEGSDTSYSFSHFGSSEKLFVFEAPIDMLSYLTLFPENWQEHSYIAMNGVYEHAVLTALKGRFNLSEIVLCTDNDEGGIDAVDRLTDILRDNGYDRISRLASKFKDWNEDLKAQHGIEPIPAESHRRKEIYYEAVSALKYFSCTPDRLAERLTRAYQSGEYGCLAEYALAGSAFFIGRKDEKSVFERLKSKLYRDYRAYSDRGKLRAKQDNLKISLHTVLRDFKQNSARTQEQTMKTAKSLFMLADCAVKADVEEQLTAQIQMQALEQNEQSEEISEGMCLGYG